MTACRFVVLWHQAGPLSDRGSHWDLMVEDGDALATWALEQDPHTKAQEALELPRHRLDYLEFEGPLSGGRGSVSRWDAGVVQLLDKSHSQWTCRLRGERIQGVFLLRRVDDVVWTLTFAEATSAAGSEK